MDSYKTYSNVEALKLIVLSFCFGPSCVCCQNNIPCILAAAGHKGNNWKNFKMKDSFKLLGKWELIIKSCYSNICLTIETKHVCPPIIQAGLCIASFAQKQGSSAALNRLGEIKDCCFAIRSYMLFKLWPGMWDVFNVSHLYQMCYRVIIQFLTYTLKSVLIFKV